MKRSVVLLFALCFVAVTGCATSMYDTAPAGDGSVYAVGAKEERPVIWKCPAQPGQGECKQIKVVEND